MTSSLFQALPRKFHSIWHLTRFLPRKEKLLAKSSTNTLWARKRTHF
ncbi:unnamed protein product [Chondrus crispus]|uniref:Uncharacterized protein n=1 Tax=Chondrus crispus TaxID=2769 RepID=R7QRD0_CHOCR|nr:unnamed protein product [Chondrus crispus]CDF40026.1 unnamed protein product [Chondrus crispus]|eukprot:XP_005710320.1 unnamed protein product [Chondrus crispus]